MLPNPLHPTLVHLPIALLLFGALSAFISLFYYKKNLLLITVLILLLGTLSTYIATLGGHMAEKQILALYPEVKTAIEQHTIQGYRLLLASVLATTFAFFALYYSQHTKTNKLLRLLTVLASGALLFFLIKTGENGGKIVYEDIIGISADNTPKDHLDHQKPIA